MNREETEQRFQGCFLHGFRQSGDEPRLTWMPLSEDAPMYKKTPYSTGMGIN